MKTSNLIFAILLAAVALMSGCANTDSRPASSRNSNSNVAYGVIDAIETTRVSSNEIGAGAIVGGVVGGILGHQVGGGTGKDVSTIAGVAGGAVVGHQLEKNSKQQDAYRIQIRLERGGYQTVTQSITDLRVGDRVRIENNHVTRY